MSLRVGAYVLACLESQCLVPKASAQFLEIRLSGDQCGAMRRRGLGQRSGPPESQMPAYTCSILVRLLEVRLNAHDVKLMIHPFA